MRYLASAKSRGIIRSYIILFALVWLYKTEARDIPSNVLLTSEFAFIQPV